MKLSGKRYKGYRRFYVGAAILVMALLGLIGTVVRALHGMPSVGGCVVLFVVIAPWVLRGAYLLAAKGRAIRQEQVRREQELLDLTPRD